MYKLIPLFAILPLVSCDSKDKPGEVKVEGVNFSPKDANCEVWLPKEPEEKNLLQGRRLFELKTEQKGRYILLVAANAKPIDIADQQAVDKAFTDAKDALADQFRGGAAKKKKKKKEMEHLTLKEKYTLAEKYPAIKIEIAVAKASGNPGFIVLTPARAYGVAVVGPKDFVESPEAKKFLESFKVKE